EWSRYWPAGRARRVPLPTYPFANDQPRIDGPGYRAVRPEAASRPAPAVAGHLGGADIEDYVKRVVADISGIPADRLDVHVPLEHYGLSSVLIAQLNERLERDLGSVSKTLFFEHADLAGVAGALAGRSSRACAAVPDVLQTLREPE